MAAQKEARDDQAQPSIASLVRPNIRALKPYRCARDDYTEGVLLDANENPFGACLALEVPQMGAAVVDVEDATRSNKAHLDAAQSHLDLALHRYPDPYQVQLKTAIARHRHLPAGRAGVDRLFTGVGSDEAIDLLMRVFCRPGGVDSVLVCSPTYGMYRVSAAVNDINVVDVPLREDFHINVEAVGMLVHIL